MWHNPVPYRLIRTEDSESFLRFPVGTTGLPCGRHPGAYGVQRRHHTHEGVDLYVPVGSPVYAVESGRALAVKPFTGPHAGVGLSHWLNTYAVWVQGESGVVLYGELEPKVTPGQAIVAGDLIGLVLRVLRNDKGRPTSMLHLELHTDGSTEAPEWLIHEHKPTVLRDPTPYLLPLCI